jgi:hypothetical protein
LVRLEYRFYSSLAQLFNAYSHTPFRQPQKLLWPFEHSIVQNFSGLPEIRFFDGLNSETVSESTRIMIFKISILLIGLGSLMICTHNLIILTKTKEMIRYCESFGYGGKTLSTHVSIILT